MAEWGEKSPMPVNSIHMVFNLGAFLAPPTTVPFLAKSNKSLGMDFLDTSQGLAMDWIYPEDHKLSNFSLMESNNSTTETRVYIPFAMYGAIGVIAGLIFLGFYISGWEYESAKRASQSQESQVTVSGRTDRWLVIVMATSMFFAYFGIVTQNKAIAYYLFYMAINSSIQIKSKQRAALLNTVYNAICVVSRILGVIMTRFIKIHFMVFGSAFAILAIGILLVLFGFKNELSFWILTCAMALVSGPCYACVLSWADRYIPMRGLLVSVLDIGIGSGSFMSIYLGGYILHHFKPVYIFVMCAAGSLLVVIVLIPLQIYCSKKGDRFRT